MDFPRHLSASNSTIYNPVWPEFEFVRNFIVALIISTFDEDPMKTESARLETKFIHYKVFFFGFFSALKGK